MRRYQIGPDGTLAVDCSRPELRNGATWMINSVGSPLQRLRQNVIVTTHTVD